MAKNKKNTNKSNYTNQENQYYTYHPVYGYIPADNGMNAQNSTQQSPPNYGQGYGQSYGQGYGSMQMNHTMQLNAMQEEINQLKANMGGNINNNNNKQNSITPEKMQEIYAVVDEIAKGQAGPEKLLPFMQNTSMDFWKGLAIGAGAILVYNCTPLKDIINGLFAGTLSSFMPQNTNTDNEFDDDGFDDEVDAEVKEQ